MSTNNTGGTEAEQAKNVPKPQEVNRYQIYVDINGVVLEDIDGSSIKYQEVCDYWRANFPVRILTISVPYRKIHKLLHAKKTEVNGFSELYDVNILVTPLEDNGFKNKAFNDGAFKGMIKQNDTPNDFMETHTEDSATVRNDRIDMSTTIVMYLYRENELKFNNATINRVYTGGITLSAMFKDVFVATNPNTKFVVSKFENTESISNFILPSMGYMDFLELMEADTGFFKTGYMNFIEHGILFFLNKENNVNVTNAKLEQHIRLDVVREMTDKVDRYVRKLDDTNYNASCGVGDIKISLSNSASFNNSIVYITPSNKRFVHGKSLTRNTQTVMKLTETTPVEKIPNLVYEFAEIKIPFNSVNFLTPLSKITLVDSIGQPRIYRLSKKETVVQSSVTCDTKITGFRVVEAKKTN